MNTKNTVFVLITLLFCFQSARFLTSAASLAHLEGIVLDAYTAHPIPNATIELGSYLADARGWQQLANTTTDRNGHFTFQVLSGTTYGVLAFSGSRGQGYTYAPRLQLITVNANTTVSLPLHPAMSLIFDGELLFIEATKPSDHYSYTLLTHGSSDECIQQYGTSPPCTNFLDLPPNFVILPIDCFALNLSAMIVTDSSTRFHNFIIDVDRNTLFQGNLVHVDLHQYLAQFNFNLTSTYLSSSLQHLAEVEQKGFYVTEEKQTLAHSQTLLEFAATRLSEQQFDEAHADLRESFLNIMETDKRLTEIYANASSSVAILTGFITLTALALSTFLFKPRLPRYLALVSFFLILFVAFYLVYPGFTLLSPSSLSWALLVAIVIALGTIFFLPHLLDDKIRSIFSLANLNLKKRRFRFFLTCISIIILTLSFVSLTSFASGYGLVVSKSSSSLPNSLGVLLKHPRGSEGISVMSFLPIDSSILTVIQHKAQVLAVAPVMESTPEARSIGSLSNTSSKNLLPLYGILGILPSVELPITHLDTMLVAGRTLTDEDEHTVLISLRAADQLAVKLNDELILSTMLARVNVTVVGFLEDDQLSSVTDVDGESFLPKKFVFDKDTGAFSLTSCSSDEILITSLHLASHLFGVFISRLHVVLTDWSLAPSFSRQIALERGLVAAYSSGTEVYQIGVGSYLEVKGSSIVLPWVIVVLSIITTTLNSVHEQKKEIAIFSSIGLNPSHIINMFAAEAVITGLIGGSLGYLLGLGSYKIMSVLSIVPEVHAKVSALWSVATISISTITVLVGALVALRSSVIITPSLARRWYLDPRQDGVPDSVNSASQIPVQIREGDLNSMFDYVITKFKSHITSQGADLGRGNIKQSIETIEDVDIIRVKLNYVLGQQFKLGGHPFEFIAKKQRGEQVYHLEVICKSDDETVRNTTTFIRSTLIEWSASHR